MKKIRNFLIAILLVIILSISTVCFAADANETQSNTSTSNNTTEVVKDDLYLYGGDINLDKIVDGNVYLFGKNITISGEVRGNLFICATGNVTFEDSSYVSASTYVVAKNVTFNSFSSSLYVVCNELTIPLNHGTNKDLYALTSKTTLLGNVGRNAYISANDLVISSDSAQGSITGNLTYSTGTEMQFPNGVVGGECNYISTESQKKAATNVLDILIGIVNSIFAASLVYLLYKFFLEEGLEKSSSCLSHHFGKVLLTGVVAFIVIPILSLILILSQIATTVGLILLLLFVTLMGISPYILASILARRIYNNKKFSKVAVEYLLAIIIAVVIGALEMIPYIGIILTIFISILGFGVIIYNLFFNGKKNKKETI